MAEAISVARVDRITHKITGVYSSIAEAARHHDVNPEMISRALRWGKLCCGYEWKRCRKVARE